MITDTGKRLLLYRYKGNTVTKDNHVSEISHMIRLIIVKPLITMRYIATSVAMSIIKTVLWIKGYKYDSFSKFYNLNYHTSDELRAAKLLRWVVSLSSAGKIMSYNKLEPTN